MLDGGRWNAARRYMVSCEEVALEEAFDWGTMQMRPQSEDNLQTLVNILSGGKQRNWKVYDVKLAGAQLSARLFYRSEPRWVEIKHGGRVMASVLSDYQLTVNLKPGAKLKVTQIFTDVDCGTEPREGFTARKSYIRTPA